VIYGGIKHQFILRASRLLIFLNVAQLTDSFACSTGTPVCYCCSVCLMHKIWYVHEVRYPTRSDNIIIPSMIRLF